MLRSLSLPKRSCSFASAWRRYHFPRIETRQNHWQARASPESVEVSEGLFLKEAYNPLWNSTSPLKEIASLDDFGTAAVQKLMGTPQEKDIPLHKFLDHLLRPVPTTAEILEMGGTAELNDIETDTTETLSEEYDMSTLIQQLDAGSSNHDPVLIVRPPKRKPDLHLTPVDTRLVSTSAMDATTNVVSDTFARSITVIPEIPSTSYDLEVVERQWTDSPPGLELHEQILCAIESQNMALFREAIKSRAWPSAHDIGPKTNDVLKFIITQSSSSTEAYEHLTNFINTNRDYYLRDDIIISLGIRRITEHGVKSAIELLRSTKHLSLVRLRHRSHGPNYKQYEEMFSVALSKGDFNDSVNLFEGLSEIGMLNHPIAVRSWLSTVLESKNDIGVNLSRWIKISDIVGSTEGVDLIWDKILKDNSCNRAILGLIFKHCQKLEHSFSTLGELICALIRNNKLNEAELLFAKVFISGKYFHKPLKRFVAEGQLSAVENVADLMTKYFFEEKKRGVKTIITSEHPQSLKTDCSDVLSRAVDEFIGKSGKKSKLERQNISSSGMKEKKIKRHRINENQLYGLAICVRNAWYKLATDEISRKRLRSWCERNGVEQLK